MSRLWDPDWSHLVQIMTGAISWLAQVEFRQSDSEFLAPTLTVFWSPSVRLFGLWASFQHLSALTVLFN